MGTAVTAAIGINVGEDTLDACLLAPGIESPTVSSLHDPDWVAVRVMIPRLNTNHVMDALYELGARAILISSIHNARL